MKIFVDSLTGNFLPELAGSALFLCIVDLITPRECGLGAG